MKRIAILGLVALCSCASPKLEREVYKTAPLTIILDSEEGINRSFQLFTMGQRPNKRVAGFQINNQIYSRHDDPYTLGHELLHILKGKYHE